jgi:HEPN domain-containing protein
MKNNIVKRFISWRISGLFVAEKRLKALLNADTKEGASDKELDALYKMISGELKAISDMQNEIITLQLIDEENQK